QDVAHWLAVPISPFRRDRHDLPILGDHESRRPNHFSASLDSRFSRVRVDAPKGNGIGAAPPRFGNRIVLAVVVCLVAPGGAAPMRSSPFAASFYAIALGF